MAQSGYTPIQLYYSTTAAAVPTAGNLANGELAINITDGKLYYKNNSGVVTLIAGATAGPAGGSNTQVQYNSSGVLAGSSNMTFDGTTLTLGANPILSGGTANGVTYLNGSKVLTSGSALTFDGTTLTSVNNSTSSSILLSRTSAVARNWALGVDGDGGFRLTDSTGSVVVLSALPSGVAFLASESELAFKYNSSTEGMRLTSTGLGIGTSSPSQKLEVNGLAVFGNSVNNNSITVIRTGANASSFSVQAYTDAVNLSYTYTSQGLKFYDATAGAERLRITNTGAVSFGSSGTATGTSGQVLTSSGSGSAPTWTTISAGSAATPTVLGTVYGSMTTSGASPYLTALGYNAAPSITGVGNVAVGYQAGYAITSGTQNIAIGYNAFNTGDGSGGANTVVGTTAGQNISGSVNTAVGANSMRFQGTGSGNTAIGYGTMGLQNSPTVYNFSNSTAVGKDALGSQRSGPNDAFGALALYYNTTGTSNVAFGYEALKFNTTGSNSVAIGYQALSLANPATSGFGGDTVAIGYRALYSAGTVASNSTGACTAVGHLAGYSTTSAGNGANDTFIGYVAGYYNVSGYSNTFVGAQAGYGQTSGDTNTCIGYGTGRQTSGAGGGKLVAVGSSAGAANSGNDNTFVGAGAGSANTGGIENAYFGTYAGISNNGSSNVAVGKASMYSATGASRNTCAGYNSGYYISSGTENTCIGSRAGEYEVQLTTGTNNTLIGNNTRTNASSDTNSVVVSGDARGKGSNTGYINAGGGGVYQGNNSSSWTTTSDQRLKKNIVNNDTGLEKILQIQVRNFEYRTEDEITELEKHNVIKKAGVQLGVIAQEIAQIVPETVKTETSGVMSVDPDPLTWYLVNAIKELNAKIEAQAVEIALLKGN